LEEKVSKIVSPRVGKFLKEKFGYNAPSLYVYDNGEKKFWAEKASNPIPAPTVIEAVEFLWEAGLKIYNVPEGMKSRGIIQLGDRKVKMCKLGDTTSESFNTCLEFLSEGGR
jgi:hypothetical protein